jgi:hypothetical protein
MHTGLKYSLQRFCKPLVVGSNPTAGSNLYTWFAWTKNNRFDYLDHLD